jgi:hypothetical protein
MKHLLFTLTLVASVFFSNAQLEYNLNFNSGTEPTGFTFNGMSVGDYELGANCDQNFGLITTAGIASNGNTAISVLTPVSQYTTAEPNVSISFNLYAFQANLKCSDLLASFPCPTSVTVYLVSTAFSGNGAPDAGMILGQSPTLTVTPNTLNNLLVPFNANVPNGTAFKVYLDFNTNCTGQGGFRFVLDNIRIFGIGQITLPVHFRSFNANRKSSSVVGLSWTTASEQNNKGFYIQRKDNGEWKDIAFVFSATEDGSSSSDLSYSYNDPNNAKGVSQYRILQVDIDGNGRYTDIRTIKGIGQTSKLLVYPNPSATGDVNIVFDDNTEKNVIVHDISGKLIKKYSNVINNLVVQGLKSGVYSFEVSDASGLKLTEKVIVR